MYDTTSSKEALCGTDTMVDDDSSSVKTQSITDFTIFNAVSHSNIDSNKSKEKNMYRETSNDSMLGNHANKRRDTKKKNKIKVDLNVSNRNKQEIDFTVMHHGRPNPVTMDTKNREVVTMAMQNAKDLMLDRGSQARYLTQSRRSPASLSEEWDLNNFTMSPADLQ